LEFSAFSSQYISEVQHTANMNYTGSKWNFMIIRPIQLFLIY